MKKIITKAVCLLCAGALVLGAAGCSKSADSSSAASSTAAAVYGSAEDYDYENFSYSSGLDENGYWEGVKALDYVTLPENFASLTFKRSEIEPTEEEIQAKIAAGQISFDPGTGWQWPVPGHYKITSTFGPRIHPITGLPGNHTGTDIAAPKGTAILSARGGVVTISTYNNSYGNYVVVQHDNGIATLYAHMSSRAVSEGQVVTQGQTLGYVGSTGSSTGNHLHLEFRVNGKRQDALNYYPNLSFTYS